jgi:hypothetical protein
MTDPPAHPPAPARDDLVARLSRLRPMDHGDDDPHPIPGERDSGHPIYPGPPVPLPRWLWGGKKKKSRDR